MSSFRIHTYLYSGGNWAGAELYVVQPKDDILSVLTQLSTFAGGKLQHISLLFDYTLVRDIRALREDDHIVASDVPRNQIPTAPPQSPTINKDLLLKLLSQIPDPTLTKSGAATNAMGPISNLYG